MKSEPLNFRHGRLGIKLCHGEIGEIVQRECESQKNGRDHAAPVAKRAAIGGFYPIARKMGCNQGILLDRKENGLQSADFTRLQEKIGVLHREVLKNAHFRQINKKNGFVSANGSKRR